MGESLITRRGGGGADHPFAIFGLEPRYEGEIASDLGTSLSGGVTSTSKSTVQFYAPTLFPKHGTKIAERDIIVHDVIDVSDGSCHSFGIMFVYAASSGSITVHYFESNQRFAVSSFSGAKYWIYRPSDLND